MKSEVCLDEFREFKKKYVDAFFPKNVNTWSSRALYECMSDHDLMEELKKYLSITNDNTDAERLNSIMIELRGKSVYWFEQANLIKNDINKEFDLISRAMIYFGILESINELSSFSDELIFLLKTKYGDNFLTIIQKVDKIYLSDDTKKIMQTSEKSIDLTDDLLKKYLVMKKWQDMQHEFFLQMVEPKVYKLEEEYMESNPLSIPVGRKNPQLYKKFLELTKKNLISIEELAKCYLAGMREEIVKIAGGKSYGLTILKSLGIEIPDTYVVPVTASDFSLKDYSGLDKDCHYSVRSSADIEDGKNNSFAGMFDSYLDIKYDDIPKNILKVINSKNNNRLQKYIEKNKLEQPNMAVIIQKFIEPEKAGVWIGKSLTGGFLEYVDGNGEKLVSGKITPNREIWENGTCNGEPLVDCNKAIGEQLLEMQREVCGTDSVADFEWMILNDKLIMLQYRPVTAKMDIFVNDNITEEYSPDGKKIFHGIAASPGCVSGSAKFVRRINELESWHEGDILMAWFTDPEWMEVLSKSSGVVTAVGGFLCHSAIIARELGIPCVIGIGQNMKQLWDEEAILVDGTNGIVHGKQIRK